MSVRVALGPESTPTYLSKQCKLPLTACQFVQPMWLHISTQIDISTQVLQEFLPVH
jgi:hypothetical protein